MIRVSVIIPTFGKPIFLEKAINSVLSQTLLDWELIIVDDNNPEDEARYLTKELVGTYHDSRIKYIVHDRNRNGAVARNTGIEAAKGNFVSFLDSDDEYAPERLERCCNVLDGASLNIAGVYTGCEFRRHSRKYHAEKTVPSGNFLVETLACRFMFCTGSNIFVRKSVVDELKGFDPTFLRHQDYEFLVRVFERYSLIGIPEILVIKNNENFNLPNVDKQIKIKNQYLEKYKDLISSLSEKEQSYIYFWKNVTIAEGAMAQNRFKLANHYYNEAQNYGLLSCKTWFRRLVYPIYNLVHK